MSLSPSQNTVPTNTAQKPHENLTTETVESATLSLECVDNVEGCDGLPLRMLSISTGKSQYIGGYCERGWYRGGGTYTASRITPSRKVFRTPRVSS